MKNRRNIFIVVAGGNVAAERHFEDTIQQKRKLDEVIQFLTQQEIRNLKEVYHGSDFIAWGAVPGPMNETRWMRMEVGDVVLIYNQGFIRFVGEVAAKVRNKELARFLWRETREGSTWELMYFVVNEEKIKVPLEKLNKLLGYKPHYRPRGFSMIDEEVVTKFLRNYGDIFGVLKALEKGEAPIQIPAERKIIIDDVEKQLRQAPTEHSEMQWRLIRLGTLAKFDVWIPKVDQSKEYQGNRFKDLVLREFREAYDVPPSIKNIDVVWRFGPYSIKSAFEIEHSTSIYSGILRLSDLRALNPNSNYPLFIVASEKRKKKVLDELRRPTFSAPGLRLDEVIRFLGYMELREIDEAFKNEKEFDLHVLLKAGKGI